LKARYYRIVAEWIKRRSRLSTKRFGSNAQTLNLRKIRVTTNIMRHLCGLLLALAGLTACASGGQSGSSSDGAPAAAEAAPANQSAPAAPAQPAVALTDHQWVLSEAQDAKANPQPGWLQSGAGDISLRFADGRVGVSGLCNMLTAPYTVQGQNIQILRPAGTLKMCVSETLMRYEQQFALRLPQAASWSISAGEHPVLTLTFKEGGRWLFKPKSTP
jgi:heat shock protein HslJ